MDRVTYSDTEKNLTVTIRKYIEELKEDPNVKIGKIIDDFIEDYLEKHK